MRVRRKMHVFLVKQMHEKLYIILEKISSISLRYQSMSHARARGRASALLPQTVSGFQVALCKQRKRKVSLAFKTFDHNGSNDKLHRKP